MNRFGWWTAAVLVYGSFLVLVHMVNRWLFEPAEAIVMTCGCIVVAVIVIVNERRSKAGLPKI